MWKPYTEKVFSGATKVPLFLGKVLVQPGTFFMNF